MEYYIYLKTYSRYAEHVRKTLSRLICCINEKYCVKMLWFPNNKSDFVKFLPYIHIIDSSGELLHYGFVLEDEDRWKEN